MKCATPIWRRCRNEGIMVLQNMIFPKKGICEEEELYFHDREGTATCEDGHLFVPKGEAVSFLTYFNSFSAGKWREYTRVRDVEAVLEFEGRCEVSLCRARMRGEKLERELVGEAKGARHEDGRSCLPFTPGQEEWIYYVSVKALEDTRILGGGYETAAEISREPVSIAIGICTYRREEYVKKTLETLRTQVLENAGSELGSHVQVFVSDNGNTLSVDELSGEKIHVVYNKNAGGSGGFGRCMLEALRSQERYSFTHILLMDDDIILEPEAIFRTYAFLSVLRQEFHGYLLGGSVLRLDLPYIQNENGAVWTNGQFGVLKSGYDLRQESNVVQNEERMRVEYNGWWYCCIPMGEEFGSSFPLPVFIHIDDVEYCLRYDGHIITLNGIGVWHGAFFNRRASSMEYYDMRNGLICDAIHHPEYTKKRIKDRICHQLVAKLLKFRYEDQLVILRGVEDYCKGVGFLKEKDPVLLNGEIMQMGYPQQDVSSLLEQCRVDKYYQKPSEQELYHPQPFSLKHKLSLNGWLLPGKKDCIPIAMGAHPRYGYRCKKSLLLEPDTHKGFLVKRRWSQMFVTVGRCIKARRLINKNYESVVADYQQHAHELKTREFWEKYLDV